MYLSFLSWILDAQTLPNLAESLLAVALVQGAIEDWGSVMQADHSEAWHGWRVQHFWESGRDLRIRLFHD